MTGRSPLDKFSQAARQLKRNKACGVDGVPAGLWKAMCCKDNSSHVPESWPDATVRAIFKKTDTTLCKNYRPISLISAGYAVEPPEGAGSIPVLADSVWFPLALGEFGAFLPLFPPAQGPHPKILSSRPAVKLLAGKG